MGTRANRNGQGGPTNHQPKAGTIPPGKFPLPHGPMATGKVPPARPAHMPRKG